MMKVTVENPTSTTKAVRTSDGLPTILAGDKITAEVNWSLFEKERYEAAGLVITEARPGRPKSKPTEG